MRRATKRRWSRWTAAPTCSEGSLGGAAAWLCPTGVVLVETSVAQAPVTATVLEAAGFRTRTTRSVLDDTVVVATRG